MATEKKLKSNKGRKGNLAFSKCTVATQPALFIYPQTKAAGEGDNMERKIENGMLVIVKGKASRKNPYGGRYGMVMDDRHNATVKSDGIWICLDQVNDEQAKRQDAKWDYFYSRELRISNQEEIAKRMQGHQIGRFNARLLEDRPAWNERYQTARILKAGTVVNITGYSERTQRFAAAKGIFTLNVTQDQVEPTE